MNTIPKGYSYYTRRFLNRPGEEGLACILACVRGTWAQLRIHDCTRSVELSLSAYDQEERSEESFENPTEKLLILERSIRGLRLALLKDAKAKGYHAKEVE